MFALFTGNTCLIILHLFLANTVLPALDAEFAHSLLTVYTNTTKCLPLLQNLTGILLRCTEMECYFMS